MVLSAADPIFGGPEMLPVAFTLFAFFAAFGVAATLLIWCWPAAWKRWFQLVPSKGSWRLEAAIMVSHVAFWVLAIFVVIGMVAYRWRPVATGAIAGSLVLGRLALDICLHHCLGTEEKAD